MEKRIFSVLFLLCAMQLCLINEALYAHEEELEGEFSANYLFDYPDRAGPRIDWSTNVQGISHDEDHWYVTQEEFLWRVPVDRDLTRPFRICALYNRETGFCNIWGGHSEGVSARYIFALPDEDNDLDGYDHFGDPTYFEYPSFSGEGYVLVPVENEDDGDDPRYVLFFRASDNLEYLGKIDFHNMTGDFVGVDPSGQLYIPQDDSEGVLQFLIYRMDWPSVETGNLHAAAIKSVIMLDEEGERLFLKDERQGGDISSQGHLLYLSTGETSGDRSDNGLHVFDLHSRKRLAKSEQDGDFEFRFNPVWYEGDSPQGLTYWDFDEVGSPNPPGIEGQLHAFLLNNNLDDKDEIYLKHYDIEEPDIKSWELERETIQDGIVRHYYAEDYIKAGNRFIVNGSASFNFKEGGYVHLTEGFEVSLGGVLVVHKN